MKKYLKKYYIETISIVILIVFSLLNMYKAPLLSVKYNNYFIKQIIWFLTGILIYLIIYKIKFKTIFKLRYILYGLNILLLIYVLIFSKSTNGIKAWVKIGPFTLQPSELIKITFPLCTIRLIKNRKYLLSLILFIVPSILILLEPDTGNVILLFFIYLYLLFNKETKKYIITFFVSLLIIFITSLVIFKYYPNIFINTFNGSLYYRFKRLFQINKNYQINNSLIGIGSASLLPIKINKLLIYIPEGITDFIFSFSICNYGIILTIFLLITYFMFIYSILKRYKKGLYYLKKKLIGTFIVVFTIQSIYNISMNIGFLPIMGIPLPFISYGGSNIISYFILYSLTTKKISSIEDKGNNNYKNNYRKVLVGKNS